MINGGPKESRRDFFRALVLGLSAAGAGWLFRNRRVVPGARGCASGKRCSRCRFLSGCSRPGAERWRRLRG